MNRAKITRIVPVSNQILLVVFRDTQTELHNAKFLLHQIPDLKPRSNPDDFKAFLYQNEYLISEWEQAVDFDTPNCNNETTQIILSIPVDEWAEMSAAYAKMHITVEQVVSALVNFIAVPGATVALDQWFDEFISKKFS